MRLHSTPSFARRTFLAIGAFAALTGVVSLESVVQAIVERFPGRVGEANAGAARAGHLHVVRLREPTHG